MGALGALLVDGAPVVTHPPGELGCLLGMAAEWLLPTWRNLQVLENGEKFAPKKGSRRVIICFKIPKTWGFQGLTLV